MSKAANIYWGSRSSKRTRAKATVNKTTVRGTLPVWASALLAVVMFAFVFLALNYRGIMNVREEVRQNEILNQKLQNLMDENLVLQEEIHTLKTDKKVIEREANKIGLDLKVQPNSVPAK